MGEEEIKAKEFDYDSAFKINSGILSGAEQQKIRSARITIVGVGGAGALLLSLSPEAAPPTLRWLILMSIH